MSHIIQTWQGDEAKTKARKGGWLEPQMAEQAKDIEKLELVGSSFEDPGPDWTEFKAYDSSGKQIASRRWDGY